ncbi:MAG TPA: YggS family pyridoxal phosphate-dependent enzyme [Pyrinomonadaceae bacterium]|nr:YggS family pyridoxal phosphate-dependent enzyme [Pyrinomonadaceae bacterium]
MTENLAERLAKVRDKIAAAAQAAGRSADEITLIAVSKTHPAPVLREAIAAGAGVLGENKVQEAEEKISEIGREKAVWHLIGRLQSNKARKAARLFDAIHTLDSIELAARLERICIEENVSTLSVFVQVDLAGEATKAGIDENALPELIEYLRGASCERLKLEGLMTLPPFFEDAEKVRPFFARLRELRDRFAPGGKLSMGMSHDFRAAIEEGATHVRVGTAIFGERNYANR